MSGAARNLHPIVRDEIYRIGYEAMTNAYTHSGASRLQIIRKKWSEALSLTDDAAS